MPATYPHSLKARADTAWHTEAANTAPSAGLRRGGLRFTAQRARRCCRDGKQRAQQFVSSADYVAVIGLEHTGHHMWESVFRCAGARETVLSCFYYLRDRDLRQKVINFWGETPKRGRLCGAAYLRRQ